MAAAAAVEVHLASLAAAVTLVAILDEPEVFRAAAVVVAEARRRLEADTAMGELSQTVINLDVGNCTMRKFI